METQIKQLMDTLGISREEALDVIDCDKRIDKGEKLFELTKEQQANVKKATSTGTRKSTSTKRERKEDTDKRELMGIIAEALGEVADEQTITNAEREINFVYKNRKFKVVLSAPRT